MRGRTSLIVAAGTLAVLILLPYVPAWAVPLVLIDGQEYYPLGLHLDILEDREGSLSLDDVRSAPVNARFTRSTSRTLVYGFTRSAYWFRFELSDRRSDRERLYFVLDAPFYDSIILYLPGEGGDYRRLSTGDQVPFTRRLVNHRNFIFPIAPCTGAVQTGYLRIRSDDSMMIPAFISTPRYFNLRDRRYTFCYGLYYGIILIMLLYNLFLYLSLRDRNYLYYIAYIASYVMFQATYNGFSFIVLWPRSPWWNHQALAFFTSLGLAAGLAFARSFLDIAATRRRLDGVFRVASVIMFVFAFASLFIDKRAGLLTINVLAGVLSILTLCAGVLAVWRGYRPARYFLAGWSFFLGGVIVVALMNIGVLPYNVFTNHAAQIGSVIEITLLSLALADRITLMKREKAEAQGEVIRIKDAQREMLERLVAERTGELELERNRLNERNQSMEHELHLARQIQQQYIPTRSPVPYIATLYRPMAKVGGDYFDFIRFRESPRIGIFISDVSGHGVPAALVTSMVKTAILESSSHRERPAELLGFVNDIICGQTGGNFVTAIYGIYDPRTREFTYAVAGHPPPLAIGVESVQCFAIDRTLPLGIMTNHDLAAIGKGYREKTAHLEPGTKLLLYTDGLTETPDRDGVRRFEYDGLSESLRRLQSLEPDDFVRTLHEDLVAYRGSEELDDDVCLICLSVGNG